MYIKSLSIEDNTTEIIIENPTWKQVKDAIVSLNGLNINTVMLEKNYDCEFMSISGGGNNKLYICTFHSELEGDGEIHLYNPSKNWHKTIEITRIFPGLYSSETVCKKKIKKAIEVKMWS